MAEVEDCRTFQVNGMETEEMKTKIVEDDEALNDEPLNTENSQVSEITVEETESDEVEEMDDRVTLDEQQENGLSTVMEGEELSAVEIMQRAVERVEAESELKRKESGIDEEKQIVVGVVEEQAVEDRIEDQVPDITATNADISITSMDSIEELPTSEEQTMEIKTSALIEQETELPVESGNVTVEVALITEAVLTEEEQTSVSSEVEEPQEISKIEAVLEEESAPVEKSTPVQDDEAEEFPTEYNTASPETKFEVEIQEVDEAQSEMEQAQDTPKHIELFEITEESAAKQSLATDEFETVTEESSGAKVGAEGAQKEEDIDNERIEPSNVDLSNEEQQPETWDNEAIKLSEDNAGEEEKSVASAETPEEKLETIHSYSASSLKFDETNDVPMTTSPVVNQEFTFDESFANSVTEDKVILRKVSGVEEKYPSRKTSAIGEVPSRKASAIKGTAFSRQASVAENEKPPSRKTSEVREKKPLSRKSSEIQETGPPSRKTSEMDGGVIRREASTVQEEEIPSRKSSAIRKISSEIKEEGKITEISPKSTAALESVKEEERTKLVKSESKVEPEPEPNFEVAAEVEIAGIISEVPSSELEYKVATKDTTAEDVADEVKKIRETEKVDEDEKYAIGDERKSPPPVRQRISSPLRKRSPSPIKRRQERSPSPIRKRQDRSPSPMKRKAVYESSYRSYGHDTYRQRGPPPRIPSYLSFSSYTPVEKTTYTPISPWIQNTVQKYRSDYSTVSTYKPQPIYTSIFDDIVSSGPFSSNLYSANRLLERSRSRSRELRNAHRSKRSTSNYYRYTSNYAITPLRTRDYSTPPLPSAHHSSRSGSFISFLAYSRRKQDELERSSSRISAIDGLNRASSRSNVDMFYGKERLSRVDSYVRDSSRNTDYGFLNTHTKYRSWSRPYLPQVYTPTTRYRAYPTTYLPSSSSALSRIHSGFTRHWTRGS